MGVSSSSYFARWFSKTHRTQPRNIYIGRQDLNTIWYPDNVIRNQKYNIITFLPLVLFEEFSVFTSLYFLVMACTQFVPIFSVGYIATYWIPLVFFTSITLIREGYDEIKRAYRDKEINSQKYTLITADGHEEKVPSSKLKVSDVILIKKDQRVPADLVLLQTSDKSGTCFIRTDQLDGETDWKLRVAVHLTQSLEDISVLFSDKTQKIKIHTEPPGLSIHEFNGVLSWNQDESLSVENVLWSNTVIATGEAIGCVIYTGSDTRAVMNTSKPRSKFGLVDDEINTLVKLLFCGALILSFVMIILRGFQGVWYLYLIRFFLLFSYMIPVSLRVNLDLSKIAYSIFIERDGNIPNTTVRSSTIPEELGRVGYLLTDKTGTLTQNSMVFKRLSLASVLYSSENYEEVSKFLTEMYSKPNTKVDDSQDTRAATTKLPFGRTGRSVKKTDAIKVTEAVRALALCHNVTPVFDEIQAAPLMSSEKSSDDRYASNETTNTTIGSDTMELMARAEPLKVVSYQASSPDEIAIVEWTEKIGLTLVDRNLKSITLKLNSTQQVFEYDILQLFPFTSEAKRMGIIVRDKQTNEIIFYLKGADIVMQSIVQYDDWLQEQCSNMAREGLRTLVVGKKVLTNEQYQEFEGRFNKARLQTVNRNRCMGEVIETIEQDMELLCVTGVEDKLQVNVRQTLEDLRKSGIKIWMLTGDKLETATCIAKSSKLIGRNQETFTLRQVATSEECQLEMNLFKRKTNACLVVTGDALQICLSFFEKELMKLIIQSPAVVVCRCSPTQKATVVDLLKKYGNPKVRVCAIGDGGNDVSMIQSAHVGIGIVGKEGKQASLAADFSIYQFSYLCRLLFVHGRNSYTRSSALSQFIIHRGLIFTVMQAIFSSIFYFAAVAAYPGFLLVCYATIYTMLPVFSLVLDKDIPSAVALLYPELYKDLSKGRSLSFKTFLLWVLISLYQGSAIMYGSLILFDQDFVHIVSITFTSLLLTELLMIAIIVRTWHPLMIIGELLSFIAFIVSLILFKSYFDALFLQSWSFIWRVVVITLVSCLPLYILKIVQICCIPPKYEKLTQYTMLK